MIFEIRNTRDKFGERKPCANAVLDGVYFIGEKDVNRYAIEINTMQELTDLAKELCLASVKISFPLNNKPLIEVYI